MKMSRIRNGLSLVETLVVLGTISLLVAILLPAVQQAREKSRRLHCQNNLHQIGVAISNYYATHECVPPGYIGDPFGMADPCRTIHNTAAAGPGWGWGVFLLPVLDQASLYIELAPERKQLICDVPSGPQLSPEVGSSDLQRRLLKVYICPSATDPDLNPTRMPRPSTHAKSNYVGVAGIDYSGRRDSDGLEGLFVDGTRYCRRLRDCTDGVSNTLAVGERFRRDIDAVLTEQFPGEKDKLGEYQGAFWIGAAPDTTVAGCVGLLGLAGSRFSLNGTSTNAFASQHGGGGHFLLGDGSVRFINENTDQNLMSYLATINDSHSADLP